MERLRPRANFWAEVGGQVVLSQWRVQLLRAIGESGSISAAAQQLGIDYRLAWQRIHEMEQGLGQQLVDTQVGGAGGGGASLTPLAIDLIARWEAFVRGLDAVVAARFGDAFPPPAGE